MRISDWSSDVCSSDLVVSGGGAVMEPGLETAGASWAEGLAAPAVRELRAYDPGHDLVALRRRDAATGVLELGSKANPYGPSPRAPEAAPAALGEEIGRGHV